MQFIIFAPAVFFTDWEKEAIKVNIKFFLMPTTSLFSCIFDGFCVYTFHHSFVIRLLSVLQMANTISNRRDHPCSVPAVTHTVFAPRYPTEVSLIY